MKRPSANSGHRNNGEKKLSAAAQAAMARASGQPSPLPRSPYATPRRKIKSIFYRIVYGSIISGNPTQQSDKARTLFRRSLVACLLLIYVPLMGAGYVLVNYASSKNDAADQGAMQSIQLNNLLQQSFPHGSFFFGHTGHEVSIPKKSIWKPSRNPVQQKLLDDEEIDVEEEKERCERYGVGYTDETLSRRRRLFLGALLAEESMEVLQAIGTESYNIFHTVSYIENNATHNWKYGLQAGYLSKLQQLFGPNTKVSVDYYVSASNSTSTDDFSLRNSALQREGNTLRWKMNGMTKGDVAIVADADTTFSRDFLRALQICDFPELRPGQTCDQSMVSGVTLAFEGSPMCPAGEGKRGVYPSAVLGECVDRIGGDASASRRRAEHEWRGDIHVNRTEGYGTYQNHSLLEKEGVIGSTTTDSNYPLWSAADIWLSNAGKLYTSSAGSAIGYHFRNFIMSWNEIDIREADSDLAVGADCALGKGSGIRSSFSRRTGYSMPVYYLNQDVRMARHRQWRSIVKKGKNHVNV